MDGIKKFITRQPPIGEKDDYDSENSWISDGLPSSSRRWRRGGGRWEVGEWRESQVQARSTLTSTAPKARSRSGGVATLDEVPRISLRASSKLPSSLSSVITALARTSAYLGTTAAFARTVASSLTPSKAEEGRRAEMWMLFCFFLI